MEQKLKLELIKKLLKKEGEEGFSLLELVVVVAVLAVLAAIAIPSFICFPKRAKATAALAALRQIKTECVYKSNMSLPRVFTPGALNGYTIQTSGSNSCDGANGVISAVPDDKTNFPTFNLASTTGLLTYYFRGITGENISSCLNSICDPIDTNSDRISNLALKNTFEANTFVVADTYVERDCSAYVLVEGPSWEEAELNAKTLGGNLASVNDPKEHAWIAKEFAKDKYSYDGDTNKGDPANWINLWIGGEYDSKSGKWGWSSGQEFGKDGFDGIGENDPGYGTGKGTDNVDPATRSKMLAHFNHSKNENQHTRHGEGSGSYYWDATTGNSNNTRGIAEIPTCKK